jgi:pentatricopeptide repeat protein
MVEACGAWQQLRAALDLVGELRARGLPGGGEGEAAFALLRAALKAGDSTLACEAYAALTGSRRRRNGASGRGASAGGEEGGGEEGGRGSSPPPAPPPASQLLLPPETLRALVDLAARGGAPALALSALDDLREVLGKGTLRRFVPKAAGASGEGGGEAEAEEDDFGEEEPEPVPGDSDEEGCDSDEDGGDGGGGEGAESDAEKGAESGGELDDGGGGNGGVDGERLPHSIVLPPPPPPINAPAYNSVIVAAAKAGDPRTALAAYRRMADDGVVPNTKTFSALLASTGGGNGSERGLAALSRAVPRGRGRRARAAFSSALAACEKGGHWAAAEALFEKMAAAGALPSNDGGEAPAASSLGKGGGSERRPRRPRLRPTFAAPAAPPAAPAGEAATRPLLAELEGARLVPFFSSPVAAAAAAAESGSKPPAGGGGTNPSNPGGGSSSVNNPAAAPFNSVIAAAAHAGRRPARAPPSTACSAPECPRTPCRSPT